MDKKPFATLEQLREIERTYPTPFYLYDEKGIRENAARLKQAFSWNRGYKEYFAVKATPNPFLLNILKDMGCGTDCSSMTELMMSRACGFSGSDIMFSSNDTPPEEFAYAEKLVFAEYPAVTLDASLPAKAMYLKQGYQTAEFHCLPAEKMAFLCYDVMVKQR